MKNWNGLLLAAAAGMLFTHPVSAAPPASAAKVAADGDPVGKAQSELASKTATFGTILAADHAVAKALEAHNLADAQKIIGKTGAFQGTVTQVYSPNDHDIVILDFDKKYKTALTAVVMPGDYGKFPDLSTLQGKHVLITGTWSAPKGKPQITLTDPAQIKVIQ